TLVLLLAIATLTGVASAQTPAASHIEWASAFGTWSINGQASSTYTFTSPQICQILNPYNGSSYTFNTNAPILINDLGTPANSEVVAVSSVSSNPCGFAPTSPAHSHPLPFLVQSGTAGLQEAINAATGTSTHEGTVFLDSAWWTAANAMPGTSGAAIVAAAAGSTSVNLVDISTAPFKYYAWTGATYAATTTLTGGNGSSFVYYTAQENLTLLTNNTVTNTTASLLHANSLIDIVQGYVTTTITSSCTGWELGDSGSATRFSTNNTNLTAGTGTVPSSTQPPLQATTNVASTTAGMYQAAAASVKVTCAGGNPGAGAIRIIVYGRTFALPTS